MTKYNIEGGVDFFSELYKSLDEPEEKTEDDKNKCLITNQPLTDKYVTLTCGHNFNYIALYHDLVNHKQKFNQMEGPESKLNTNEIRCPYCRKKQSVILNYYEELGLEKVNGVNFYDPNCKQSVKCEYLYPNPDYDPNQEESVVNKKYLNESCCFIGSKIAVLNSLNPSQPINYGDTKYYCYTHKKQMIKNYKLIICKDKL